MSLRDTFFLGPRLTVSLVSGPIVRPADLENIQDFTNDAVSKLSDAVGDIHNSSNFDNILGVEPLFITNIGRAIGDISQIEPIYKVEGNLASSFINTDKLTYNALPHPANPELLTVGCKFDGFRFKDDVSRNCLKNLPQFYTGTDTSICQNTDCPMWSGNPDVQGSTEYRLLIPTEQREIISGKTIASINAGISTANAYRIDTGDIVQLGDIHDFWNTADRTLRVGAGSNPLKYRIPYANDGAGSVRLDIFVPGEASTYDMEVAAPVAWVAGDILTGVTSGATAILLENLGGTTLTVTDIQGTFDVGGGEDIDNGTTTEAVVSIAANAETYNVFENGTLLGTITTDPDLDFNEASFDATIIGRDYIRLNVANTDTRLNARTLVSFIRVIDTDSVPHPNTGIKLTTPEVFKTWSPGSKLPENMFQLFDTTTNSTIEKVEFFTNLYDKVFPRSAVDVKLHAVDGIPQTLDVDSTRYIVYTIGTDMMTLLSKLVESFLNHISDNSIHLSITDICALLGNPELCCQDTLIANVSPLTPTISDDVPSTIVYKVDIQGGNGPYRLDVQWGDGTSETFFSEAESTTSITVSHSYGEGIFRPRMIVQDGKFNCTVDLSSSLGPVVIGEIIDAELSMRTAPVAPISWPGDYTYVANVTDEITSGDELTLVGNQSVRSDTFDWVITNLDENIITVYVEKFEVANHLSIIPGGSLDLGVTFGETRTLRHKSFTIKDSSTGEFMIEDTDYSVDYNTKVITNTSLPSLVDIEYKVYPAPLGVPTGNKPSEDPGHWAFLTTSTATEINVTQLTANSIPVSAVADPAEIDVIHVKIEAVN